MKTDGAKSNFTENPMTRTISITIASLLASLLLSTCAQIFSKLDNPLDPKASNYQGYETVERAADLALVYPASGGTLAGIKVTVTKVLDATAYQVHVAASAAALASATPVDAVSNIVDISSLSIADKTGYFWQARAKGSDGNWGLWSIMSSFATAWTAAATPTFSPVAGSYSSDQSVTISTTTGATIYYTTDGTLPSNFSTRYSGAISLGVGMTVVRAVVIAKGYADSPSATGAFTIMGWEPQAVSLPSSEAWSQIAYGNGLFVAVSSAHSQNGNGYDTNAAATSTDGKKWTQQTLPSFQGWGPVSYGNGVFVAIAGNAYMGSPGQSNVAATSSDGIAWTQQSLPSSHAWRSMCFGNGIFVAIAEDNMAVTSPNGTIWTQHALPRNDYWGSISYGDGLFVAIPSYDNVIATSPDGVTWTQQTVPSSSYLGSICYGNGLFIAVPWIASIALTSPDGITWTQRNIGQQWLNSIAYGNGLFVATNYENPAMITSDGIVWEALNMPGAAWGVSVIYGNGVFLALQSNNTVAISVH